jgi:hypothetical protein
MTGEKYEWAGAFTAIEAAMTGAASQRWAEFAVSEAERRGLIKQGDANGAYQDKVWERTADGVILRLSRNHASRGAIFHVRLAVARRRSVRLDRCGSTRCATHWGLICLVGGSSGHAAPWLRGRTASGQARRRGTVLPPGSSSATARECARYVRSRAPRS